MSAIEPLSSGTALRRRLHPAAWDLGDLQAIEKGPTAYGRRLVRKRAYAKTNGLLASILRDIGL